MDERQDALGDVKFLQIVCAANFLVGLPLPFIAIHRQDLLQPVMSNDSERNIQFCAVVEV